MAREISEIDNLQAENALLRETLVWFVRNTLDSAARNRAKETLRKIDPSIAWEAEQNESERYGEWRI